MLDQASRDKAFCRSCPAGFANAFRRVGQRISTASCNNYSTAVEAVKMLISEEVPKSTMTYLS